MAGTAAPASSTVPHPRRPLGSGPGPGSGPGAGPGSGGGSGGGSAAAPDGREEVRLRHWYENDLGWATVPEAPGEPLRLVTGVRFDVLEMPAEAGAKALRHLGPGSPVALQGGRLRLLMAAGGAEELPGLLDWLEWGALALDLRALGAGGRMDAPARPETEHSGARPLPGPADGRAQAVQGAAVWLRPPEPGCEVEASLPTLSAVGRVDGAPDLVRLVDSVATECHRARLRRAGRGVPDSQALASS
ncbi:SCO3374 family protein [Streptomyces sp. NPDC051985]|uniref:SCO3374 family protein n=1 Tax=Streptomyces sp. NPDC051985 TaxID=3155807 RepID=UPI003441EA06